MTSLNNFLLFIILMLIGGCNSQRLFVDKAEYPLSKSLTLSMKKQRTSAYHPALIRIFKKEKILEIWKLNDDYQYVLLKKYDICAWSGTFGPKIEIGDGQAPEGFYYIGWNNLNPNSKYFLSINIGFPNEFDKTHNRTGTDLMIHGGCESAGCYAMDNKQMVEIYAIIRDSLRGNMQSYVQIQAFPFRMTSKNMKIYRDHPSYLFWNMLKIGHDYFENTHQEPIVKILNKHYIFLKE
ncbi:murein L,D-transpeptidase family protein [Candidatus Liberibacter brunswickensis]|uniref:murein L,D-transpeptidase family protein n=1 Tax=Candidatus Liberibacter brunswickensis TaxID=1968796 RepID=UPI002FE2A0F5